HRADHQGAAAGVRGRAQPVGPAPDGGLRRLSPRRPSRPPGEKAVGRHRGVRAMGFDKEHVENLSRALDEPSWLTERRLEAWGYYEKLELPREKDEPWRYTDLRRLGFDLEDFSPAEPSPYDAGLALERDPKLEERGVVLLPLYNAIQTRPELVQRHLLSQGNPGQDIFTALHTAFLSGGTFLYVPRGVDLEIPVEATRTLLEGGVGLFPHTLVVVAEGSSVVFLDRYRSDNLTRPRLSDAGVEIVVGAGASVILVGVPEYVWGGGNAVRRRCVVGGGGA